MSGLVRRSTTAALLIAGLRGAAFAEPPTPAQNHDPAVLVTAPQAATTPWLDLGAAPIVSEDNRPATEDHRVAAALTLGGLYAGFTTWTYFA